MFLSLACQILQKYQRTGILRILRAALRALYTKAYSQIYPHEFNSTKIPDSMYLATGNSGKCAT
jgi:hypothetical protein